MGEFFAPLLGGRPKDWADANRAMAATLFEASAWMQRLRSASSYAAFLDRYHLDWLGSMCAIVGVPTPSDERALILARQAERWIIPQVNGAYPGADEAILTLHSSGYRLCTASGEGAPELHDYLSSMGVRERFDRLYGSDLIDTFKIGPEYYERAFADAGVAPRDAIVVDDRPEALAWAAQVGAMTVLVSERGDPSAAAWRVPSLRWLPELLVAASIAPL